MDLKGFICLILSTLAIHFTQAEEKRSLVDGSKSSLEGTEGKAPVGDLSASELDKRRWSNFNTWGKRKWNNFGTWGKRWASAFPTWGKKWSDSSFATWGKRSQDDVEAQKRTWNQFITWGKRNWHALPTWGKRSQDEADKKWSMMSTWGKRNNWDKFATWGKRSEEDVRNTLLKNFDQNGDETLDEEELSDILIWLSSEAKMAVRQ